ncbi:hypothetical protein ACMFMF_001802 [Clarireedia jacksonii]
MRRRVVSVLWTLVLCPIISTNAQLLPYNPTTILLPSSASASQDVAYIFLEASQLDTRPEFVFLNISSTISTSNLTLESFSPNLPFLTNGTAYVPAISSSGVITVYTGSCSSPANNELWVFTTTNGSAGNGSWTKQTVDLSSDAMSADLTGAEFLAGAFSFSTIVDANATLTDIYMYGGMCPNTSTTVSTWQSAGSYSNRMVRLTPQASDSAYTLDVVTNRGAPIAEAGFTITGLPPMYSNASGIMTQARNYILLGGHTRTAFINMSQVAVWSLPEESWSFVTIDSPSASEGSNTELAVKSAVATVDSRSGHTAVLSEDGSSVIVLGGWVGDVNQAAEPQLAVLKLGTGFGGTGDWIWSIPSNQPSGDGIYGHGAVMLPGNVMMVIGGFNITASANAKRAINLDSQAMFFNATSLEWTSNYTNPSYLAALDRKGDKSSSSSTSREIGLGIGLGIGLVALLALIGFAIRWLIRSRRRRTERHEAREKDLRALSFGAAAAYSAPGDMSQNGAYVWSNNGWQENYNDNHEPYANSTSAVAGYERLHTGEYSPVENAPAMKARQVSRKPLRSARGVYQPAPTFDPGPAAVGHVKSNSLGTAGPIHPIYEADEEVDPISPIGVGVALPLGETSMASVPLISVSKRQSDPFKDPPANHCNFSTPLQRDNRSASAPPAESPVQEREREIEAWVADWAAADALLNAQAKSHSNLGRLSPTRRVQLIAASGPNSVAGDLSEYSGRTASNLSERSIATLSRSGSSSQGTRSNSLLGYINHALNTITAGGVPLSPTPDNLSVINNKGRPPGSSGSETASTSNTAHSSFPSLQAEASTLLPRPDVSDRSNQSPIRTPSQSPTKETFDHIGSPSKNKPNGLSRRGILGSIRRVFSAESDDYDEPFAAREPSPIPIEPDNTPRRAVSASATLWRRKQGKTDWEDSAKSGKKTTRSNTVTGERPNLHARTGEAKALVHGIDDEDEEWDIERAVEDRVVQVMFTVPREKLRVVNHDVLEDISEAGSVGGRSRVASASGSGTLSRKGSEVLKSGAGGGSSGAASNSSLRGKGKGKGKVSELVDRLEGRNTPDRGSTPERR